MLEKLHKFADENNMLPKSGLVLVCVSGGADSMCLLHAMIGISQNHGFSIAAVHMNHMLRGIESDRDEEFVRGYCTEHNISIDIKRVNTKQYAAEQGLGIEEAARNLRYQFYNEIIDMTDAVRCATAHTADDNAETIIMNLTRGTGLTGLRGIPPNRDKFIRPMLQITRTEIMKYIAENNIPFVEDSSNSQDIYTRNKLRHSVIPILKEINPGFLDAVSSMASLIRADEQFLSQMSDEFIQKYCRSGSVDAKKLADLPDAVSGRVIRKMSGVNLTHSHVKAVRQLSKHKNPSASLSLPGIVVSRVYQQLIFGVDVLPKLFLPIYPSIDECVIIPGLELKMTCNLVRYNDTINKSLTKFLFKYIGLCGRITVRPRRPGDKIRLQGSNCTKSLKKLFIERQIPAARRQLYPVIADDRGVLAVYGLGRGELPSDNLNPGDLALEIAFEGGM